MNFQISSFFVFRPFWFQKTFKMNLKVVLELLLDVPEVLLEVLDLSRRSWRWFLRVKPNTFREYLPRDP